MLLREGLVQTFDVLNPGRRHRCASHFRVALDPYGRSSLLEPKRLTGDAPGRFGAPLRTPKRSRLTLRRGAACCTAFNGIAEARLHQLPDGPTQPTEHDPTTQARCRTQRGKVKTRASLQRSVKTNPARYPLTRHPITPLLWGRNSIQTRNKSPMCPADF